MSIKSCQILVFVVVADLIGGSFFLGDRSFDSPDRLLGSGFSLFLVDFLDFEQSPDLID